MQLVILGMHRSGTSFLTRMLQLMGVWIGGPEELDPPGWGNPRGLYELTDLRIVHEKALARRGCSWAGVGPLAAPGARADLDADLREEVRRLVARLDGKRPWAVKDPRSCLFFGAWRDLLVRPLVLLVHRSPLAVARSLARRDGFPPIASVALWELYNLHALRASQGLPRLHLSFEEALSDPLGFAARLKARLEAVGVTGLVEVDRAALAAYKDPEVDGTYPDPDEQSRYLSPLGVKLRDALQRDPSPESVEDWGLDETTREVLALLHRVVDSEEALRREELRGAEAEDQRAKLQAWGDDLHRDLVKVLAERTDDVARYDRLVADLARELRVFRNGTRGRLLDWLASLLFPRGRAGLEGLVDPGFYRETNPDVAATGADPVEHWLEHGSREGRRPRRS